MSCECPKRALAFEPLNRDHVHIKIMYFNPTYRPRQQTVFEKFKNQFLFCLKQLKIIIDVQKKSSYDFDQSLEQ